MGSLRSHELVSPGVNVSIDVGNPCRPWENDLPHLGTYLWGYLHISHRTGGDTSKVATEKLRKMMINHGIESTLDGLTFFQEAINPGSLTPTRKSPKEPEEVDFRSVRLSTSQPEEWLVGSMDFKCPDLGWLLPWLLFFNAVETSNNRNSVAVLPKILVAAKLTGHSCWGSWWRIHNLKMDISSMY